MERRRIPRDGNWGLSSDSIEKDEQNNLLQDNMPETSRASFREDKLNILILFFLYVLQGIPLGLGGSLPMILQNRNVGYKDQATFSLVTWPFSMKLLWAPIVDSLFFSRFGRRKTWLIPTQYLIGIFMLVLSRYINLLMGSDTEPPNVILLTLTFSSMNFLAATQDIVVDGWALTMLSRKNVGYASTCNSVGQTTGFFLGNVVFLALESANFCNSYLRSEPQTEGIVTLSSFLYFWGIIFLITTTLVAVFKKEIDERTPESLGIVGTYKRLYSILYLRNIWLITAFLLTCKIAFAATDAVTGLKLIEAGVLKENIALLAVPMVPLQILLPLLISKYTAGPRPLMVFLKVYPYRLAFSLLFAVLVWWTHRVKSDLGGFPVYYYVIIAVSYAFHQITVYSIFVALMAFYAKVSDPSIGGTYMTLLNTLTNLGGNWPSTLALWWVDPLTTRVCEGAPLLSCDTKELSLKCTESGHTCAITRDGYYVETIICVIFGIIWLNLWGKKVIGRLQQLPMSAWKSPR